jgi:excisionase family DNA binding protein
MNLDNKKWGSPRETADLLGLHVQTIYALFYRGELPGARVGRSVRIDLKRLTEQMEAQEHSGRKKQGDPK